MYKNTKVLLYGFGNIAHIHSKYLTILNIDWNWYDPYIKNNNFARVAEISKKTLAAYTHVMVCTPEIFHYDNYTEIRKKGFEGKILVEKPAVLKKNELFILKDRNLSVGLVERFNPCIDVLKKYFIATDCASLDFVRCSFARDNNPRVNAFVDVGLHDLDLFFHLCNPSINSFDLHRGIDTFFLTISFNKNSVARFVWSNETFAKERSITARLDDCTLQADLLDQTVKNHGPKATIENLYVEKYSPIKRQLEHFLSSSPPNLSQKSHEFFVSCLEKFEIL